MLWPHFEIFDWLQQSYKVVVSKCREIVGLKAVLIFLLQLFVDKLIPIWDSISLSRIYAIGIYLTSFNFILQYIIDHKLNVFAIIFRTPNQFIYSFRFYRRNFFEQTIMNAFALFNNSRMDR